MQWKIGNETLECAKYEDQTHAKDIVHNKITLNSTKMRVILITGVAGFIGFHISMNILQSNPDLELIGVDNLNDYYSILLKKQRIKLLQKFSRFSLIKTDICNTELLIELCFKRNVDTIIHMAAQPGVRYSQHNTKAYIHSNIQGHLSILEVCRSIGSFNRLIYASSSSVYGNSTSTSRFSILDNVSKPCSLYGATKIADEVMSYAYSHLYGLNIIGLRFFTVYGPWGRPDMAAFVFTTAIIHNDPIQLYNLGNMQRDFTYIDDIVQGVISCLNIEIEGHKIYNLGNGNSVTLHEIIQILEEEIGKKARIIYAPMQDGEVISTCADITESVRDLGFRPQTNIKTGIKFFIEWYKSYYRDM